MEQSEREGSISLNTLRKMANSMDCELVYAIVPKNSFDYILRQRKLEKAKKIFKIVHHSMKLEDQALPHFAEQIEEIAATIKINHRLWHD